MDRHLYNKDELSEFGPFNGSAMYSARRMAPTSGDMIHVVSGSATTPKRYFFHGVYRYTCEVGTDKPKRRKYLISPFTALNPPIEITREMLPTGHTFNTFICDRFSSLAPLPSEYKSIYDLILHSNPQHDTALETDLTQITAPAVRATGIIRDVLCRLGQGEFKKNVIEVWGSKSCALTGIDVPEMLIASHIKPWAECEAGEHLDGCNGILFASHIDKLFDSHLITFRKDINDFFLEVNPRCAATIEKHFKIQHRKLNLGAMNPSNSRALGAFMEIHNKAFDVKLKDRLATL